MTSTVALPPIIDIILRLLSAGGIVTLVGLWWRRDVALRKISSSEAGDIRDHYAAEVKRYSEEMDRVVARQLACEQREQALRERVMTLEEDIRGLHRQIARYSSDQLVVLEEGNAPAAAASAERVRKIVEDK